MFKGVFLVDYRDETASALCAIELLPPLDARVAELSNLALKGITVLGDCDLSNLLCSGVARFEPRFQALPDREDLHPCPPPTWSNEVPPAVLPAMDVHCHGFGLEARPTLMSILRKCSSGYEGNSGSLEGVPKRVSFTFAELFAGIGGFRLALESVGGQCVFASEMHPTARAVYLENWLGGPGSSQEHTLAGDLRLVPTEEVPEHDVLVGGFPCQPFSSLGKQDGLQDSRGRLFLHVCRVLREKKPLATLLENVPGLLKCHNGAAMAEVIKGLNESGYRVACRVLDSSTVLPQVRRRVYIVAIRADLSSACESFRFPWLPKLSRPVSDVLEEHVPNELQQALTVSEKYWLQVIASQAFREKPDDIVANPAEPSAPLISSYGSHASGSYFRVTQFVPQKGSRPRLLTQRECARLQGFPESFRIDHCAAQHMAWYKRIGNAVSVPIVAAVADALLVALGKSDTSAQRGCAASELPGTRAALVSAFRACPESVKPQFLARQFYLPNGSGPVSVAAFLNVLSDVCQGNHRAEAYGLERDVHSCTSQQIPLPGRMWRRVQGILSLKCCCTPFLLKDAV